MRPGFSYERTPVSTVIMLIATMALGVLLGQFAAQRQTRKLRSLLHLAQHAANHDPLTGLPNRSMVEQLFTSAQRHAQPTIIALLDVDHFKWVNDTYGHHVGDALLCTIAGRLNDAAGIHRGTAARLGGDEFALILPARDESATAIVELILQGLTQATRLHTDDGTVTFHPKASAGSTVHNAVHTTFAEAMHHADIALYHAKRTPERHSTYHPDMRMPATAGRHGLRLRDRRQHGDGQSSGEVTA